MTNFPLQKHSLMFAPMEGITDECYRNLILDNYPEWDTVSCDFLRVPNPAPYPQKHILKHYGNKIYKAPNKREKNIYQILTSPGAYTENTVRNIQELGFKWLDLNLGCPSKTVCKNQGGSFLLSQPEKLRTIIKEIRANFKHTFTCKIRIGFEDDSHFERILKMLEDEGVDAIKIHARTRVQLYKGVADWSYVKEAVRHVNIPIIGNGDIWSTDDIHKYFDYTNCHSIMLARSALKTPWLAMLYKKNIQESNVDRALRIKDYFVNFYHATADYQKDEIARIKRMKSVSRYIFDDMNEGDIIKRKILLAKTFEEQSQALDELILKQS